MRENNRSIPRARGPESSSLTLPRSLRATSRSHRLTRPAHPRPSPRARTVPKLTPRAVHGVAHRRQAPVPEVRSSAGGAPREGALLPGSACGACGQRRVRAQVGCGTSRSLLRSGLLRPPGAGLDPAATWAGPGPHGSAGCPRPPAVLRDAAHGAAPVYPRDRWHGDRSLTQPWGSGSSGGVIVHAVLFAIWRRYCAHAGVLRSGEGYAAGVQHSTQSGLYGALGDEWRRGEPEAGRGETRGLVLCSFLCFCC